MPSSDEGFVGILGLVFLFVLMGLLSLLGLLDFGSSFNLGALICADLCLDSRPVRPAYLQTVALGSAGLLKEVKGPGPVFGRLLFSSAFGRL